MLTKRCTPQEYYQREYWAEYKSDFYHGAIIPWCGGTSRHSRIIANVMCELNQRLRHTKWMVLEANMRLKVAGSDLRCYPDVSVYSPPLQVDPEDPYRQTLTNPTVLVEVLSSETEAYERGVRAVCYRHIPSLRACLIVLQDTPHVELYVRRPDNQWELKDVAGAANEVSIPPVQVVLPMSEVYENVEFGDGR